MKKDSTKIALTIALAMLGGALLCKVVSSIPCKGKTK